MDRTPPVVGTDNSRILEEAKIIVAEIAARDFSDGERGADEELAAAEEGRGDNYFGFVFGFLFCFVWMIFPSRELGKPTQRDINTKLATANLSHTKIGLTSMIMNYTNQEIVIQ